MNQRNPLVSIITPCYNGEKCVSRLMDSIIAQTYRPIEFIIVNDGSTDGTRSVLESYIPKFQDSGIEFLIINQENKGVGEAINAGLKRFTGEYLCWPDSDDFLEPTSVEEKVKVLEENPEYAVVTSNAYYMHCENMDYKWVQYDESKQNIDENQFLYHLNAESIFCPGCHMVRASMFLTVCPCREIYPARRGQNWQLLLPLYYKYKRKFLNKPLYNYVIYPNSLSRTDQNLEAILQLYKDHESILVATLDYIRKTQNSDLHAFYSLLDDKYAKLRMEAAIRFNNKELFKKEFVNKQQTTGIDINDLVSSFMIQSPFFYWGFRYGARIIRKPVPPAPDNATKKVRRRVEIIRGEYNEIKVSVLVPCYNASNFLQNCFNSLLRQSHRNLQVLIMNDGSTDDSEMILNDAVKLFEQAGIEYQHYYQNNKGAAAAVAGLLPHADGKYLMLYDVDDILFKESIFEQVSYMENHPDYHMVRTNGYVVNDLGEPGKRLFEINKSNMRKEFIFDDLVSGLAYNWAGSYMIRRDEFKKRTRDQIYISRYGQNLQFMMPMAYESKVGYINKPLMTYYEHIGSHSHEDEKDKVIERIHGYANNRIEILRSIPMKTEDREHYLRIVRENELKELEKYENYENDKNKKWLRPIRYTKKILNYITRNTLQFKNNIAYMLQNENEYWTEY